MKRIFLILLFTLLVLSSGCVKQNGPVTESPVKVSIDAPDKVFAGHIFTVYVDVDNRANDTLYNVSVDLFDVDGFNKFSCAGTRTKVDLGPGEIRSINCKLNFSNSVDASTKRTIHAHVIYHRYMNAIAQLVVMTPEEYEIRRRTHGLDSIPQTFVESNGDLEVTISFMENPFVQRSGKEDYMYIKVRNVGGGFIEKIRSESVKIKLVVGGQPRYITNCVKNDLYIQGSSFPQISCAIDLLPEAQNKNYLNVFVIVNLEYEYELRRSAQIQVEV